MRGGMPLDTRRSRSDTKGQTMEPDRYGIEELDYDARGGKRWFYRVFSDSRGRWYWEPRLPTERERADRFPIDGVSWTAMILPEEDWPSVGKRGPHAERSEALKAAEAWFDSLGGPSDISNLN